jgi:secondary thiamine-phosphate synthase enzyme
MKIVSHTIQLKTKGYTDILDITSKVQGNIDMTGIKTGSVLISAVGSTTGVTTVEYEPGLVEHDIAEMLNKLAPYGVNYEHNKTWGDDNGAAHLRSTLIGTSQTIPFENGKLILGTWQQIIFMDFDTRPRNREIVVQITGE